MIAVGEENMDSDNADVSSPFEPYIPGSDLPIKDYDETDYQL